MDSANERRSAGAVLTTELDIIHSNGLRDLARYIDTLGINSLAPRRGSGDFKCIIFNHRLANDTFSIFNIQWANVTLHNLRYVNAGSANGFV